MNRQKQHEHIKVALIVSIAVFFCYFFSESVLRQFVLHRAGKQKISLSSILGKLPPGIRDEVTLRITIAELKDELQAAVTVGKKINVSIQLAGLLSPEKLQEKYAEIIDKYPNEPESLPAYINFLMASPTALKSISISRYHEFIKHLKKQQRPWAWSSGLAKLKSLKASAKEQIEFLLPLLNIKPDCHEYQQLYMELSELAYQEGNQAVKLKAHKLDEMCENLPYFDEQLEKQAKAEAKKLALAKAKELKAKQAKEKELEAQKLKAKETDKSTEREE